MDHYRGGCDPDYGTIRVFPISDEQLAKPAPVPHGVNATFDIGICAGAPTTCGSDQTIKIPFGHPAPYQDLLGAPILSPAYMFGMRYEQAHKSAGVTNETALPVIVTVSSQSRDYDVALLETPVVDGVPTYHLKLTPLRRPKENRLRELWIGTSDYLPRRAVLAGNFTLAPLVDVPWAVDFAVVDGAPYVSRENTTTTLYLSHRRVVRDATIAFEDIREQTTFYQTPLVEPDASDESLEEPAPQ